MDLSEITAAQPELFQAPAAQEAEELGREDFLRMLIAQLENQDPLDPQDASEFTAQLATFSSLDQLVSMRQAIDAMAGASAVSDGLAAAGLIGKSALVESREVSIDAGGPAPGITLELPGSAEILSVGLVDVTGRTVASATDLGVLERGQHDLDWSGFDRVPPPGLYRLEVQTAAGDPTPTTLVRGPVTGAALEPSGTVLLLGEAEVPLSALREIGIDPTRSL